MRVERALNNKDAWAADNAPGVAIGKRARLFLPINASLEKQIRDIKSRLYFAKHHHASEATDSGVEASLRRQITEQSATIDSLRREALQNASQIKRLEHQVREKDTKISDLVEEFIAKDETNARDYESRIKRLKSEHERALDQIKREHELEINDRNRTHMEYVEKLCKTYFLEQEAILKRARECEEENAGLKGKIEDLQRQLRVARLDAQRVADLRHEAHENADDMVRLKDELTKLRLARHHGLWKEFTSQQHDVTEYTDNKSNKQRDAKEIELDKRLERALRIERAKKDSEQLINPVETYDLLGSPENTKHTSSCHTNDSLASPLSDAKSIMSHLDSPNYPGSQCCQKPAAGHCLSPLPMMPSACDNIYSDVDTQFMILCPRIT